MYRDLIAIKARSRDVKRVVGNASTFTVNGGGIRAHKGKERDGEKQLGRVIKFSNGRGEVAL